MSFKNTHILGADAEEHYEAAPKITAVKPVGSQILIELLHPQEAFGGSILVGEKSDFGAPQAYVRAVGPSLKSDEYGVKVGDRVLVQGTYIPAPKFCNSNRKFGILEIHNIKAVLSEETA